MIRAVFLLFATSACPAFAAENPCQNIERDPWLEARAITKMQQNRVHRRFHTSDG